MQILPVGDFSSKITYSVIEFDEKKYYNVPAEMLAKMKPVPEYTLHTNLYLGTEQSEKAYKEFLKYRNTLSVEYKHVIKTETRRITVKDIDAQNSNYMPTKHENLYFCGEYRHPIDFDENTKELYRYVTYYYSNEVSE